MLKGDLSTTPLREVLRTLAASSSTGCLRVEDAKVFLRSGRVYAVVLPDRRPRLGPRLVSSGDLDPAALAEAYDAQATELQGWRLGELLVHLGYVEQDVVESAVGEQLREAAFELLLRTCGAWRFRDGERTREDVAAPVPVDELLADLALVAPAWDALRPRVHGPDAVPVLSAAGTSPETLSLDGDAWSLLCTVDGTSSLSQLAGSSGLSLLEAAQGVVTLVDAGLVEIEAPVEEPVEEPADVLPEPEPVAELEEGAPAPAAIASRLADALRGLGPLPVLAPQPEVEQPEVEQPETGPALASTAMDGESLTRSLAPSVDDELVSGSISRASASLAATLGDLTDPFDPLALPVTAARTAPLAPLDEREAARRALDAQELAERHAALEAERAAEEQAHQRAQWQAAAFAELSAAASAVPLAQTVLPQPHADPEPPPEPVAASDDPAPTPPRGADTAALLRELSSLGLEEEAAPVPEQRVAAPTAVRPHAPLTPAGAKRRKGLFGRG